MNNNYVSLTNSYCFDRSIRDDFAQISVAADRDELVSTIQRGNRLKTPALYAELAISFMCKNYNIKINQP